MAERERRRNASQADFEIRIDKIVYGGDGLGRARGKVVFVPFSVAGDLLKVRATEEKRNFMRARIVEVIEPGPGRRRPECPYFGTCGGCQWQQLEYVRQVEAKRKILEETLQHHFPEAHDLIIPMTASPMEYHYRSRARVQVRPAGRVGFFRFRSHEVEDIERCPLLRPAVNDALTSLREQVRASGPPAPEIDIAGSEEERAWSSIPTGSGVEVLPTRSGPGIASPPGLLRRRVGPFGYLVSPGVFFQANDFLVDELARAVEEFAGGRGDRSALDLYCGVGLFSLPLARRYQSVTAVESSPSAAALCRANADSAGLNNVRVVCAEVEGWMEAVGAVSAPGFELIVLDPPRTGAGTEVMNRIRDWAPGTLIYVSCDPQTMCRDLTALPQRDYRIDEVLGIDLFPQTYHFETVLRVVRR